MGLFGTLAQARGQVLDKQEQQARQDRARNDALRQKVLEMALTMRGQNETSRHNMAGETEAANVFGETKRHNAAGEASTATGQAETGRHNLVDERIAQMRERREALLANRPDYSFLPGGLDSSGNPVYVRGEKHSGQLVPTDVKRAPTGDKNGGLQASSMAAAKANLESAIKVMNDYEAKLRKDPSQFGVWDATKGATASSPSALTVQHPWDVPMAYLANQASSNLQNTNPELAKYMTAKKFVAEAILNTHRRPNQTQYEIEQEIGGVGPNPSAMQIDLVSGRRQRLYDEVFGDHNQTNLPKANAGANTAAPAGHHVEVHNGKKFIIPD